MFIQSVTGSGSVSYHEKQIAKVTYRLWTEDVRGSIPSIRGVLQAEPAEGLFVTKLGEVLDGKMLRLHFADGRSIDFVWNTHVVGTNTYRITAFGQLP